MADAHIEKSKLSSLREVIAEFARHKFKLLCILVTSFGEALLASFSIGMIIPIASNALNDAQQPVFDLPLLKDFYPESLQLAFIYLAVLIVAKSIFGAIAKYVTLLTTQAYRIGYIKAITDQYFRRQLNPVLSEFLGHKLNNVIRETNLANTFILQFINCFQAFLNLLALLAVMLLVNVKIVIGGLIMTAIVYFTIGRWLLKLTNVYASRSMKSNKDLAHQVINALRNLHEIKLNNIFPLFSQKIEQTALRTAHEDIKYGMVRLSVPLLLEICFAVVLVALALYVGIENNFSKEQIAQLAFFVAALYRVFSEGIGLFTVILKLRYSYPSYKLIRGLINEKDAKDLNEDTEKGESLPQKVEPVYLKNISFSYNEEVPVLDNLSLSFNPGHIHAIVGPSGSGKSTLLNLLARLYRPQAGQILLGEKNAEDFSLKSWRDSIGYISQEPSFFTDTILNNITLNKASITKDSVIAACKKAGIHDDIMKLPEEYNTCVFEDGTNFSGGQRRRIALARALVKSPKILVLDETTSSIPVEDEREILKKTKNIKGLIIIFVTHRYSNLDMADEVYELCEGQIKKSAA